MKYLEIVRASAKRLNLLDKDGKMTTIDSLGIIDLVVELEKAAKMAIPTASLRQDAFKSIESIAEMLGGLEEV